MGALHQLTRKRMQLRSTNNSLRALMAKAIVSVHVASKRKAFPAGTCSAGFTYPHVLRHRLPPDGGIPCFTSNHRYRSFVGLLVFGPRALAFKTG